MKKSLPLLLLSIASLGPLLQAQVDESKVTTFQAGTPAKADEVNANFQALIEAINENANAIEANATAILSLNNGGNTVLDLDDSVFKFKGLGLYSGADSDQHGDHIASGLMAIDATLTLSSDGNYSWVESQFKDVVTRLTSEDNGTDPNTQKAVAEVESETVTTNGTWSLNGQVLTLSNLEILGTFHVSLAGDTISMVEMESQSEGIGQTASSFPVHSALLLVGTRVQ